MKGPDNPGRTTAPDRPAGHLLPECTHARSALVAIRERRIKDARMHLAAVSDGSELNRAWILLLEGMLRIESNALRDAEATLLQAAALAFIAATLDRDARPAALRLAAVALCQAGRVQRRQDRPDRASHTHRAAHDLLEEHGSCNELWETRVELGLDAALWRKHDDAEHWFRLALEAAGGADGDRPVKEAIVWTHLSQVHIDRNEPQPAVQTARHASTLWQTHDPGSAEAALARMRLGGALLKWAVALREQGDERAAGPIREAIEDLSAAHEGLSAFGQNHAADVKWCQEQLAFCRGMTADGTSHSSNGEPRPTAARAPPPA